MPEKKKWSEALKALVAKPQFMFNLWGGMGLLVVVYVLIKAMLPVQQDISPQARIDNSLLQGEMKKFSLTVLPRTAPTEEFLGPKGPTSLKQFKGKVVLVNLWASWCTPCLTEMPSLDALQAQFGTDKFTVVAIAAQPKAAQLAPPMLKKMQIQHLDYYSDEKMTFAYALGGNVSLPLSVLYDQKGQEIGRLKGEADWQSKDAKNLIATAISGSTR
ncbi:MAG: TlpA family protein disulfide reductase [bacterium]